MKIVFFVDFCLSNGQKTANIESESIKLAVASADAVVCNFEGPICEKTDVDHKIGPVLSQAEYTPELLKSLGITHASVANNHILDQGEACLSRTVERLTSSGIQAFGYT